VNRLSATINALSAQAVTLASGKFSGLGTLSGFRAFIARALHSVRRLALASRPGLRAIRHPACPADAATSRQPSMKCKDGENIDEIR
jgi:hypothetical protein